MSALSRNVWDTVANPGVVFSAGGVTNNLTGVTFSNSNGVSFGLNAGVMTASAVGGAGGGIAVSNSQTLFTSGTVAFSEGGGAITIASSAGGQSLMFSVPQTSSLVGVNGISISTNGSTISVSNIGPAISAGTVTSNASAFTFSNSNGVAFGLGTGASAGIITASYTVPTVTNSSWTVSDSATSATVARLAFVNTNGVSFALTTSNNGSQSIGASIATTYAGTGFTSTTTAGANIVATLNTSGLSMGVPAFLTTAALSQNTSNYAGINTAATNLGLSVNTNGISVSQPYASFLEPWDFNLMNNSATTNWGNQTLYLVPFNAPTPLSFDRFHMIGSVSHPTTSAANTVTFSLGTSGQSEQFAYTVNVTNANLVNLFLFSLGAGGSSTDLKTAGSTQLTFQTIQSQTYLANATCGALSVSMFISNSNSVLASYPGISSGTVTSVNAATTVTTWQTGYTTWTSSASNSTSSLIASGVTASISNGGTWPATTAWASNKLVVLPFATSLSEGMWWLGFNWSSSTNSAITTGNTSVAAGRSYTSSVNASNLTLTAQITWVGNTATLASSLGFIGQNTAASMAPSPGLGTFASTYAATKTFYNNAGQANGEIAISDIATNVSFWKPWFQMASNRI